MDLSPSVADALAASEARFRALVQHSADIAAIIDVTGQIHDVSRPVLDVGGRLVASFTGTSAWDLVHPDDRAAAHAIFAEVLSAPGAHRAAELRVERPDGAWRWIEAVATNLLDEPAVAGIVVNIRDIDRRKRAEAELYHRAHHDQLTGLPNRTLLLERLVAASDATVALLLLDVDEFKMINDTHGHAVGDTLLCLVADRLRASVRDGDTVARLGGDEFVVLCPDVTDATDATRVADQIHAAFGLPFDLGSGVRYHLDATIGIALGAAGTEPSRLLADADTAMYATKRRGRGGHGVFDDTLRLAAAARRETETALRGAVARGEICCHYQPIVDLASGRAVGVEALVRWDHGEHGLLLPDAWLPIAAASTRMVEIGRFVIAQASADAMGWHARGRAVPVTINLSARELAHEGLVAHVEAVLAQSGLPPTLLSFDITEAAVLTDEPRAVQALDDLRELGVRLALDDFGAGQASLAYLKQLPIDIVKIDRSFVAAIARDRTDRGIAHAVVQLGRLLGHTVVAEGVEDDAQWEVLRSIGCHLGQGFRWSPAVPADQVLRVLDRLQEEVSGQVHVSEP